MAEDEDLRVRGFSFFEVTLGPGALRSFSRSTVYEDRVAPVARSTNIAWSRDVDEIVGTHSSPVTSN